MVIRTLLLLLVFGSGIARADSLRLDVPDSTPVPGEMIIVTVRGEYDSTIALEKLEFPDSPSYDWMQLTRDAWGEEQVGGRRLRVLERRIAVFPRKSGSLEIGPLVHRLTVIGATGKREPVEVKAPATILNVAPEPAEGVLLSARSLKVEDSLSAAPGVLRDGETLTRRVTITAVGVLPHQLPPRPSMRAPWLISFAAPELRSTEVTADGPISTVTWEWSLRPITGEPGVLPAVAIPWFDTIGRRIQTAEILPIPFGYASFGAGRGSADQLSPTQLAKGAAAILSGVAAGFAVSFAGLSPRRRTRVLNAVRRWIPFDRTRRDLRRAARAGDYMALRKAAARYLDRRSTLGLPISGCETVRIDEIIFGRKAHTIAATKDIYADIVHGKHWFHWIRFQEKFEYRKSKRNQSGYT